ncbi:hypothetical protein ACN42_g4553 [Penicillium freii]|uniref:Uncharacterized protein n=1 Tax=Penicillium freii TaxID=48697 RepID=A0A117NPM8_PENFR|nr:hypothetical protein ACN42_g4553 [Penicillium freii]
MVLCEICFWPKFASKGSSNENAAPRAVSCPKFFPVGPLLRLLSITTFRLFAFSTFCESPIPVKYNGRSTHKICNGSPLLFGLGLPQSFHRHTEASLLNDTGNAISSETTGNCPSLSLRTIPMVQAG